MVSSVSASESQHWKALRVLSYSSVLSLCLGRTGIRREEMACSLAGGGEMEQNQAQLHPFTHFICYALIFSSGEEQGRECDAQLSRGLH